MLLNTKYSLPKKWHHRILKIELSFLSRKQLVLGITHAVKINTAVSTGSTYCPPPSSVSLLRSWSEILGCKVGPHFVANAYEFIHDQNTRRARAYSYAGVSTELTYSLQPNSSLSGRAVAMHERVIRFVYVRALPRGVWGHAPPRKFLISGLDSF